MNKIQFILFSFLGDTQFIIYCPMLVAQNPVVSKLSLTIRSNSLKPPQAILGLFPHTIASPFHIEISK